MGTVFHLMMCEYSLVDCTVQFCQILLLTITFVLLFFSILISNSMLFFFYPLFTLGLLADVPGVFPYCCSKGNFWIWNSHPQLPIKGWWRAKSLKVPCVEKPELPWKIRRKGVEWLEAMSPTTRNTQTTHGSAQAQWQGFKEAVTGLFLPYIWTWELTQPSSWI